VDLLRFLAAWMPAGVPWLLQHARAVRRTLSQAGGLFSRPALVLAGIGMRHGHDLLGQGLSRRFPDPPDALSPAGGRAGPGCPADWLRQFIWQMPPRPLPSATHRCNDRASTNISISYLEIKPDRARRTPRAGGPAREVSAMLNEATIVCSTGGR
jgi:hypothetical protein